MGRSYSEVGESGFCFGFYRVLILDIEIGVEGLLIVKVVAVSVFSFLSSS